LTHFLSVTVNKQPLTSIVGVKRMFIEHNVVEVYCFLIEDIIEHVMHLVSKI